MKIFKVGLLIFVFTVIKLNAYTVTFECDGERWAKVMQDNKLVQLFKIYPYRQIVLAEGKYVVVIGNSLTKSEFGTEVKKSETYSKIVNGQPNLYERVVIEKADIKYYQLDVKGDMTKVVSVPRMYSYVEKERLLGLLAINKDGDYSVLR